MSNISDARFACAVGDYMTAVVDNKAYILSGYNLACNATLNGCANDSEFAIISNSDILTIDFMQNFEYDPLRVGIRQRVPPTLPESSHGILWAVGKKLYRFGGDSRYQREEPLGGHPEGEPPEVSGGVWEFDVETGTWENTTQETQWAGMVEPVTFGAAACGGGSVCYLLMGRSQGKMEDRGALLAYDVEKRLWLDISVVGQMEATSRSSMMYLKALDMLVVVGGIRFDNWPRQMSTIKLFHIPTSTWYTVESPSTTLPDPRGNFCAVAISATDASSHNIYIYGGIGYASEADINQSLSDVWILTLPSFRWIRVGQAEVGKMGLTCSLIAEKYMFAYSGRPGNNVPCDTGTNGVLWDVTELEWTDTYVYPAGAVPRYRVPMAVYNIVGGNGSGGATLREPLGGLTDTRLRRIFEDAVVRPAEPTVTSPEGDQLAPIVTPVGAPISTPIGTIVGGVVGGVAVAVVIGVLVWWRARRQRNRRALERSAQEPPVEMDGGYKLETGLAEIEGRQRYEMPEVENEMPGVQPPVELEAERTSSILISRA